MLRKALDKAACTHEIVHEGNRVHISVKTLKSYTVGPCEIGGGATFSEIAGKRFEDSMSWDGDRLRLTKINRDQGYAIVGWRSIRPGQPGQPDQILYEQEVQGLDGVTKAAGVQYYDRVR